jgi:hypothetical protein
VKDWEMTCKKIMDCFDALKRMLKDRAVCSNDCILIFDLPFTIRILKQEEIIVFQLENEDVAVLSREGLKARDEEVELFVKEWCKALTSLGFKRYIIKKIPSNNPI